jgi:hypothetical protein
MTDRLAADVGVDAEAEAHWRRVASASTSTSRLEAFRKTVDRGRPSLAILRRSDRG